MKKTYRLFMPVLWLSALCLQGTAQVPDEVYHERLFYLCKVWGHAKYYHTRIAAGLVDWDNALLPAVSPARNAPTGSDFNDALLVMLNSAGPMGTSTVPLPVVPDSLNNNLDLSWMQSSFFSEPVKTILMDIKNKFRPQTNVYVGSYGAGNPNFTMDTLYYSQEAYPAEEIRMLGMFRYWNQVHYFFPYKYIMDQNWDITLQEFIPEIASATDATAYNLAFRRLTCRINDGHAKFSSETYLNWNGSDYPPFLVRFIENEMVITKVLPGITQVAVGDVITEIDGQDIDLLRDSLRQYAHGSNDPAIERNLNNLIMFGPSGYFPITVSVANGPHSETLSRNSTNYDDLQVNNSPVWYQTTTTQGCTYGVVDMDRLETEQVAAMFSELWNTDAIIFDIRNYPNGTLWTLVNYLFPAPINIASFTEPDETFPGRLEWKTVTGGSGTSNPYPGKVILLFDERSQSHTEYTCMGLEQFPGAIKIGSTTAGADGNVSPTYQTGQVLTYFTGLGTFYPDYRPTQRIGILPQYMVSPTIEGIRAGVDEVLEFALNCSLLESDYCTSSGCNAVKEWIQSVSLGDYTNNSGYNIGYGDFTGNPIYINNGTTYQLSVTPFIANNLNRRQYIRVWIDFNMDGDFTDAGELVLSANRTKVTASAAVSIPSGISGQRRMRVSMKYNAAPGPCENFAYGEVEDYTLDITAPPPPPPVANFTGNPTQLGIGQSVDFTDLSTNNPTSWLWTFEGGNPATSTVQNPSVTYDAPGLYDVTLMVSNSTGSSTLTLTDYITVTTFSGCPDNYEPNETMSSAASIPVNTNISALINTSTDLDWFTFGTNNSAKNIKITLTNLPANYDVVLCKSNGAQIGISQNTGTSDETIIYNYNKAGTYYIKVYGYNGSFDPDDCYILKAETSSAAFKTAPADLQYNDHISVYPNPANNYINVEIVAAASGSAHVTIHDLSGKIIAAKEAFIGTGESQIMLNLTGIVNGMYLLKVISPTQTHIMKIMISH